MEMILKEIVLNMAVWKAI